jgi:hypothetical protein
MARSVLCRVGLHHGARVIRSAVGLWHVCRRCGRASDVVLEDAVLRVAGWPGGDYAVTG